MPRNQKTVAELSEELSAASARIDVLLGRLGDVEARLKVMEVARPVELRKLSAETVAQAISADGFARFEVLKDWETAHLTLRAGTILRADHVRYLVDYVKSGLLLGEPTDQREVIERLRVEAEARTKAAIAEANLAKAAAQRAEAVTHAERAESIQ